MENATISDHDERKELRLQNLPSDKAEIFTTRSLLEEETNERSLPEDIKTPIIPRTIFSKDSKIM